MLCKLVLLMQLSPMTTTKFLILFELCHSMFPKVLKSIQYTSLIFTKNNRFCKYTYREMEEVKKNLMDPWQCTRTWAFTFVFD